MHGEKTLYGFSVFSSAADRDCYVEAGTPTILFRASSGECSITAIVSIRIMQHSSVRKWHTFVTNTCTGTLSLTEKVVDFKKYRLMLILSLVCVAFGSPVIDAQNVAVNVKC